MLRAIETEYKGYRFRSRLEARWAVFFDALGYEWQYEPQGFEKICWGDTIPIPYLPDFYLPKSKTWVEVKGTDEQLMEAASLLEAILSCGSPLPHFDGSYKRKDRRRYTPGLLILGDIPEPRHGLYFHRIVQGDGRLRYKWAMFTPKMPEVVHDRLLSFFLSDQGDESWTTRARFVPTTYAWDKVTNAYRAARAARFEHGESGASLKRM